MNFFSFSALANLLERLNRNVILWLSSGRSCGKPIIVTWKTTYPLTRGMMGRWWGYDSSRSPASASSPPHSPPTWSLCLMLEKMLWFQESSISFLTTLSSVRFFLATVAVVFPCVRKRGTLFRKDHTRTLLRTQNKPTNQNMKDYKTAQIIWK